MINLPLSKGIWFIPEFSAHTIDVERFAGLNICSFSPMKFLRKYFHGALATSVHYLPIAKNSQENFHSKLKTRKPQKFSPANLSPFTVMSRLTKFALVLMLMPALKNHYNYSALYTMQCWA